MNIKQLKKILTTASSLHRQAGNAGLAEKLASFSEILSANCADNEEVTEFVARVNELRRESKA
jgi:hypothetical protein